MARVAVVIGRVLLRTVLFLLLGLLALAWVVTVLVMMVTGFLTVFTTFL